MPEVLQFIRQVGEVVGLEKAGPCDEPDLRPVGAEQVGQEGHGLLPQRVRQSLKPTVVVVCIALADPQLLKLGFHVVGVAD